MEKKIQFSEVNEAGELLPLQIKSELAAASQSEISDFTLFAHFCTLLTLNAFAQWCTIIVIIVIIAPTPVS